MSRSFCVGQVDPRSTDGMCCSVLQCRAVYCREILTQPTGCVAVCFSCRGMLTQPTCELLINTFQQHCDVGAVFTKVQRFGL